MALEIHNEIKIHNDKNIVQTKEWRYTREKGIHTHVMRNNEFQILANVFAVFH